MTGDPTKTPTDQNNQNKGGADGGDNTPAATETEINERIEAARKQEKEKLYPELEKRKADGEKLETERNALQKKLDDLQAKVDADKKSEEAERKAKEDAKLSETEKLTKRLEELEASQAKDRLENETLKKQIEVVADEGARALTQADLANYRERRLREEGVQLIELVGGNTTEEIDAAITNATPREEDLATKARKEAEEQYQKKLAEVVPRPGAPSTSAGTSDVFDGKTARDIARLPADQYQAYRDKLLAKAREATGT